jgi:hypothetical protein
MNETVNASDVILLFGKSVDDPEMVSLMQEKLGTLNRPQPDYENEDYYDWVMVRRKGVELGFGDTDYHEGADDALWGKGELRLYQAYFYTAFNDVSIFQGELPLGLDFKDSRDAARKKMSRYESTRHSFITDTWDTERFRLNIRYTENHRSIERMACYQEFAPIIRKFSLDFPSLQQIVDALGADVRDPLFTGLWRREDNEEIQELVLSEGMRSAFLNRSYGVRLNFAGDQDEKQFYAITLLGHRQIESVNWEGELPFGLDFEDSPETLFQKMKKKPDERSEDMEDNTDYAVWHFPKCTLFVGYSHRDNRILRIKLYAPGIWESFRRREE